MDTKYVRSSCLDLCLDDHFTNFKTIFGFLIKHLNWTLLRVVTVLVYILSALINISWGERSRNGAVVRAFASHQCRLGSIPELGVICGLSLLLVLVLAPRGYSLDTPVCPFPQKPTFPNFNSIWIIVKHFIVSLCASTPRDIDIQ